MIVSSPVLGELETGHSDRDKTMSDVADFPAYHKQTCQQDNLVNVETRCGKRNPGSLQKTKTGFN